MTDFNETSSFQREQDISEIKSRIISIWNNIPLFIKTLLAITIIFYLINIPFHSLSLLLSNIPYYSFYKFQLWRLITSVFMTTNILKIILGLFVWVKDASNLEISLGTIKYSIIFTINTIIIQLLYGLILLFFYFITNNQKYLYYKTDDNNIVSNSGFWGVIMCEMTLLCISNPESPMKLLLLPFTVKSKIYPIILVVLYFFVSYCQFDLQIICGVLYGLFYYYYLKNVIQFPDSLALKIENNSCFKKLRTVPGFISVNQISSGIPISITKKTAKKIKKGMGSGEEISKLQVVTVDGTFEDNKDETGK